MKIHSGLGLAALVACGGGSHKGAASATAGGGATSQVSITTLAADGSAATTKFAISGPAYGVFDSASGGFHVFVVDASGGRALDCDHLKDLAAGSAKARVMDIYFNGNVTAPGKVAAAGAVGVDATGAAPSVDEGNVDGVSLDFKSIDAKSFDADVVSTSGSASGSLHGTICDGSKLRGPSNGATTVTIGNAERNDEPQTTGLFFKEDPPAAKPSCDVFTDGKKTLGKRGSVTILYATNGKHAPGKYDVYAAQSFAIMPEVTDNMDSGGTVVASVAVSKFDDKDFTAQFVSTAKLGDEKETIGGTPCPNGRVEAPAPPKAAKPARKNK